MKRFLKNNMLLILSLVMVFALVGSTYAYLAATDSQIINSFKLAKIDTSIKEQTGGNGHKVVHIQNDDISSVYVRARVLVSTGDIGATGVDFSDTATDVRPADSSVIVVYNSADWAYDSTTGWFYYKHVLPGKTGDTAPTTEALISRVLVGTGLNKTMEVNQSFEVDVYEESVLTSDTSASVAPATVKAAFENNGSNA